MFSTNPNPPLELQSPLTEEAESILVDRILRRAEPHLAHRRRRPSVSVVLAGWARPVLALAASLALLIATGARQTQPDSQWPTPQATLAASVVPEATASWLTEGYAPTVYELFAEIE